MLKAFDEEKVSIGLVTGMELTGRLSYDVVRECWFVHTERASYAINPDHVVWVRR